MSIFLHYLQTHRPLQHEEELEAEEEEEKGDMASNDPSSQHPMHAESRGRLAPGDCGGRCGQLCCH